MKLSSTIVALSLAASNVSGFAPISARRSIATQRQMFSGAGEAAPKEDDEGQLAEMEKVAKAMGMSLEEYQLGMNARVRMETDINDLRVTGGDPSKGVSVERDGNSPPRHLVITVTDDGKALGKEALEKELVGALKDAGEKSKEGRQEAQKKMMQFIAEQMKGMA
mmetsp:Transcript_8019/g.10015  ORF Transcript_8019/g.10015 Transcript_8019/m.10015 type:complete len:165 (+) Transcript_8019:140-634(+)|eukprot:CAMPEP_0203673248 /NCGR_PEP_ID=MMETSP0090-20130426/11577_1 /ASSEMBLY_ACC=CAM_ASM_001088 /TAXON_ID=426623 /ORGANISM="Chaetoceros affinis, Strain CCMP159" /LENGTH=164 /DNA_ID=CAMNT_0050538843 /DNA_START=99 /DNA_END=593 /DNA_ORIENTATION=-